MVALNNVFLLLVLAFTTFLACEAATCTIAASGNDDTANIVAAFKSCSSGGTIVFSAGKTYHWSKPGTELATLSGTNIHLEGHIVFPASTSFSSVSVYAIIKGSNVVISGGGSLDGNGQVYWNAGHTGGPKMIRFSLTGTSKVSNISVNNSPAQHISVNGCNGCSFSHVNVKIDHSRINSGHQAKNTDAFDVSSSSNVQISDSTIDNGDDCVAVNGGVHSLTIKNMKCTGGHGVSIGSLGSNNKDDVVSGVHVSNSQFHKTKYAARIKTYLVNSGNKGYANNIVFSGITVDSPTSSPICVTEHYCNNGNCGSGTVPFNLQDATFEHFTFNGVSTSHDVVGLYCQGSTCGPFKFVDVHLPSGGKVGCNHVGSNQISGLTCSTSTSSNSCN